MQFRQEGDWRVQGNKNRNSAWERKQAEHNNRDNAVEQDRVHFRFQRKPGPIKEREERLGEPSSLRNKPWNVDKERSRAEKIDRMATKIMTEEAMKIISEAYEAVFEGEGSKNQTEKQNRDELEEGQKENMDVSENDTANCSLGTVVLKEIQNCLGNSGTMEATLTENYEDNSGTVGATLTENNEHEEENIE